MPTSSLYFLDFYVPNEGEPETALEVGVLRFEASEGRPSVFLHSFIKPQTPKRVRWSNAYVVGITRERILGPQGADLPTLQELQMRNFLKDKTVICFNPNLEPFKSFCSKAHAVHSILGTWLELFGRDEKASKLLRPSQMLKYIGLPDADNSNTRYTALLCRLQSLIAIWSYLDDIKRAQLMQRRRNLTGQALSPIWPLHDVRTDYFEALNHAHNFAQVQPEILKSIFSDALPDYLDWNQLQVYSHDWVFKRRLQRSASHLGSRINSMADLIFNKVLSMQMKFWVLIFYAIYDKKTNYAREIALKDGVYADLPMAIKDDFSLFIINHLDDFLAPNQKRVLLKSIIHQVMGEQARSPFEHYDYDALYKKFSQERDNSLVFHQAKPRGGTQRCFCEIRQRNGGILYRRYEIAGNEHERSLSIEYVNELLRDFIREVQDPFALVWTPSGLRRWVQYITGFAWHDLVRPPQSNEDEQLMRNREFLRELIVQESLHWKEELKRNLVESVLAINKNPDGDYHHSFTFQGMSVELVVLAKTKTSLIARIFNF